MGETFNRKVFQNFFISLKTKTKTILISSKPVKLILFCGTIAYFSLLLTSLLITLFFGPLAYNICINTISDLGATQLNPVAYIFDIACVLAGIIVIPIFFLLEEKIAPESQQSEMSSQNSQRRYIFARWGLIIGVIGGLGYILVGIFSLDRAGPNGIYHNSSAGCAFGGFIISIFFFSLCIVLYQTRIPKIFGMYGLIAPLISLVLFMIISIPLFEWILLFSILGFLVPIDFLILF